MHEYDILVIGEVNVDLVLTGNATPVFGQAETLVGDAALTIGGSGTIFACGAARLGLRVTYCGVAGDDVFGRFMLENLHARGVDISGILLNPKLKTGLSVILSRPDDRAILTHLGAIDALQASQVNRSQIARARHVHITSYFLQHALQPGLAHVLADAHDAGATVSIDTNWDPDELWDHGLEEALAYTDVFLPNLQELQAISRETDLDLALECMVARVPTVAVKLGAEGAVCRQGRLTAHDPGFRMAVVDTTGAGDSFNAGFLCGYVNGWEMADSLALGCACGALSTRAAGGTTAQPTLDEAMELIRQRD